MRLTKRKTPPQTAEAPPPSGRRPPGTRFTLPRQVPPHGGLCSRPCCLRPTEGTGRSNGRQRLHGVGAPGPPGAPWRRSVAENAIMQLEGIHRCAFFLHGDSLAAGSFASAGVTSAIIEPGSALLTSRDLGLSRPARARGSPLARIASRSAMAWIRPNEMASAILTRPLPNADFPDQPVPGRSTAGDDAERQGGCPSETHSDISNSVRHVGGGPHGSGGSLEAIADSPVSCAGASPLNDFLWR